MKQIKINRTLFYVLTFTWGIIYGLTGCAAGLMLLLTGHKPLRWGWSWYFEIGKNPWGGMEWGPVFIVDRYSTEHIKDHEFGHAIQNCFYGPFMIFLVALPSATRYWARRIMTKRGLKPKTEYESVWFEAQATRWGSAVMKKIKGNDNNAY